MARPKTTNKNREKYPTHYEWKEAMWKILRKKIGDGFCKETPIGEHGLVKRLELQIDGTIIVAKMRGAWHATKRYNSGSVRKSDIEWMLSEIESTKKGGE